MPFLVLPLLVPSSAAVQLWQQLFHIDILTPWYIQLTALASLFVWKNTGTAAAILYVALIRLPDDVLEAARLSSKHVWHGHHFNKGYDNALGYDVGRNHETEAKIFEFCKHLSINVVERKPYRKCWKGPARKTTHEELVYFTGYKKKRSNQEERDAILMAWYEANLPVKVKVG